MNAILPTIDARIARKGAPWSASEIALAIQLRRDTDKTVPEIAAALGRTTATVYTQLRKLGVVVQQHRAWRDAELARALDALAAGQTYAAAAAAIGRTESELRSKIAYDRIDVPTRRSSARTRDAAVHGDNFTVALRAEIKAEQRPLKELARVFGVSVAMLSRLAREIHGRSYCSAASREAMRETLACARAARAAKADHGRVWTADAIARLKAFYDAAEGAPDLVAVAKAFGSTPRMVDTLARAHGFRALKRARSGLTEEAKRRAAELAAEGVPITPAARTLGVDIRTLRDYADRVGIVFVAPDRGALAKRAATTAREARGSGRPLAREAQKAARVEAIAAHALLREDRAKARAARLEARRLATLARKEEREKARAQAKAEREQAKKLAEAHAREAKRQAMLANAAARPKKAKPQATGRAELAGLVADYISKKGVTRTLLTDVDLAVAAIRRRGYGVTREDGVYRIDQMMVPAADLFAFAEKRGIKWKERSAA